MGAINQSESSQMYVTVLLIHSSLYSLITWFSVTSCLGFKPNPHFTFTGLKDDTNMLFYIHVYMHMIFCIVFTIAKRKLQIANLFKVKNLLKNAGNVPWVFYYVTYYAFIQTIFFKERKTRYILFLRVSGYLMFSTNYLQHIHNSGRGEWET